MRVPSRHGMNWLPCLAIVLSLFGCGEAGQAPPQKSTADEIHSVIQAQPVSVTPEQAAEVFALGSEATDLQRDLLSNYLIGNVVEWDVPVYEIQLKDGSFKITSQPIPIKSKQATELLRVVAFVDSMNDLDLYVLKRSKTNDVIRIRGKVQGIVMRTAVVIYPGMVIPSSP